MDKFAENISYNHGISINERKLVYITGVNKIESFDEEEFLLDTNMGFLVIKGSSLEIVRLDTKDGIVSIKGNVDSFAYFENLKKGNKSSLFDKLFKWYWMNNFFLFCLVLYGGLFTAFYLGFLNFIFYILDWNYFSILFFILLWQFYFL